MSQQAIDMDRLVTRRNNDSLLLYGSYARGDQSTESDIDILRISTKRAYREQVGKQISLHTYDIKDLMRMSSSGSLFILHLIEEGKILHDSQGFFSQLSSAFRKPESYAREARKTLWPASSLLDIDEGLFQRAPQSFMSVSVFLCRTLLYAEHADRGPLSFSLKELGTKDEIASVLFEVKDKSTHFGDFHHLRNVVRCKLGYIRNNPQHADSLRELQHRGHRDPLFRNLFRRIAREGKQALYPSAFIGIT